MAAAAAGKDKITPTHKRSASDVTFKQRCSRCVVNAVAVAVSCRDCACITLSCILFHDFCVIFGDTTRCERCQVESAYRFVSSACIFACHSMRASERLCACVCVCVNVCTGASLYVSMRCACCCFCCFLLSLFFVLVNVAKVNV